MEIIKNLVSSSKYSKKCPYRMKAEYITYHNTDNDAPAKNEVAYMISNDKQVSFHVAVDDIQAIQVIPFDRNAWHCGDGKGNGNMKSIGVEICYNSLGANNPKFKKSEDNAVEICAKLLKDNNLGIDRLKPHKHWSGKNCPSTTNHANFESRVKVKLQELNNPKSNNHENCILYANEVDKTIAEVMQWEMKDCVIKNVKDHIAWEGYNLYAVGGLAQSQLDAMKTGEKCTVIVGKDRWETLDKARAFVGK